jgi:hypothetical protein
MKIPPERIVEIQATMRRLAITFFQLGSTLQENFSEQALNEAISVVDEASRKFEEINKKLKGDQHE